MATRRNGWWLAALTVAMGTGVLTQGAVVHDRGADVPQESGLYLEADGGKQPRRLDVVTVQQQPKGIKTSMATMGFKKPKMISQLAGNAAVRVAPDSSFLFVFGQHVMGAADAMDPAKMQAASNQLAQMTSSPKDYVLIQFEAADGARTYDGSGKRLKVTTEKLNAIAYRVKPAEPLEPGEYAFTVDKMGIGQFWDFGVGAAK